MRGKVRKGKSRNRNVIFFLLPTLLLVGFILYPTVETIRWSFWEWEGRRMVSFGGLSNYTNLFTDKSFLNLSRFPTQSPPYGALMHVILWIVIFIPIIAILGLVLAVLLRDVRGGAIVKSAIFLGMVVSLVVGGMIMRFMYDEHAGIVNGFLRFMGLGGIVKTWTAFPETALFSLILGSIWIWTGFPLVIYSAGLELIPGDLFEAARVDGASSWSIFRRITVPLLTPSTIIVVIMSLMWVLRIFDIVYVATFGGPGESTTVLGLLIYFNTFYKIPPDIGRAAAIATFLILVSLPISIFLIRKTK